MATETADAPAKQSKRGRKKGQKMTAEHKQALAEGREQSRKVRDYLEALEWHKPQRGRPVTPESLQAKLDKVNEELGDPETSTVKRLELHQEQMDLEEALAAFDEEDNFHELQAEFVKVAAAYAERKGLTRKAFRKMGVPAEVLDEAGI